MRMGIGGGAEILTENETEIIYKYYNYNLNIPEHRNAEKIMDGRIIINKIRNSPYIISLFPERSDIIVVNSKNRWNIEEYCDWIALVLIRIIVNRYNQEKVYPDKVSYNN